MFFVLFTIFSNVFLKHDDWNLQEDTKALQLLQVLLCLSHVQLFVFVCVMLTSLSITQKLEALVLMNLPSSCLQLYVRFLQLCKINQKLAASLTKSCQIYLVIEGKQGLHLTDLVDIK